MPPTCLSGTVRQSHAVPLPVPVPAPAAAPAPALRCPRLHALQPFQASHPGFSCDGCGTPQTEGASLLSCRACDFDWCGACARAGAARREGARVEDARGPERRGTVLEAVGRDRIRVRWDGVKGTELLPVVGELAPVLCSLPPQLDAVPPPAATATTTTTTTTPTATEEDPPKKTTTTTTTTTTPPPPSLDRPAKFGDVITLGIILWMDKDDHDFPCSLELPDFAAHVDVTCTWTSPTTLELCEVGLRAGKNQNWSCRFGVDEFCPGTRYVLDLATLTGEVEWTSETRETAGVVSLQSTSLFHLSPQFKGTHLELVSLNTVRLNLASAAGMVLGHVGFSHGVHYWEVKVDSCGEEFGSVFVGVTERPAGVVFPRDAPTLPASGLNRWESVTSWGFVNFRATVMTAPAVSQTTEQFYGEFFTVGDTVGVLMDCDVGEVSFFLDAVKFDEQHIVRDLGVAFPPSSFSMRLPNKWNPAVSPQVWFPCLGLRRTAGNTLSLSSRHLSLPGTDVHADLANLTQLLTVLRRCWGFDGATTTTTTTTTPPPLEPPPPFPSAFLQHAYRTYVKWMCRKCRLVESRAGGRLVEVDPSDEALARACAKGGVGWVVRAGDRLVVLQSNGRELPSPEEVMVLGAREDRIWYSNVTVSFHESRREGAAWAFYWEPEELVYLEVKEGLTRTPAMAAMPAVSFPEFARVVSAPNLALDVDLVRRMNLALDNSGECDPMNVPPSAFIGEEDHSARLAMLLHLNQCIARALPLVGAVGQGAIGSILAQARELILTNTKLRFWNAMLRATTTPTALHQEDFMDPPQIRTVSVNRIKATPRKLVTIPGTSRRMKRSVFGQLYAEMHKWSDQSFRRAYCGKGHGGQKRAFKIKLVGEGVEDYGGPYRQAFEVVCDELQNDTAWPEAATSKRACLLPLFVPCPNRFNQLGDVGRDKFVMNPSAKSGSYLRRFEFLGRLIGVATRHGLQMRLDLPALVWKRLVGMDVTRQDLEEIDATFEKDLKFLESEECTAEHLVALERQFHVALSDGSLVPCESLASTTAQTLAEAAAAAHVHTAPATGSTASPPSSSGTPPLPFVPRSSSAVPPFHTAATPPVNGTGNTNNIHNSSTTNNGINNNSNHSGVFSGAPSPGLSRALSVASSVGGGERVGGGGGETGTDVDELMLEGAAAAAPHHHQGGGGSSASSAMGTTTAATSAATTTTAGSSTTMIAAVPQTTPRAATEVITPENRFEYVQRAVETRLHESDTQFAALSRGLAAVLPVELFHLFTPAELERLVCGKKELDVRQLKSITEYEGGLGEGDAHVQWFWEVLEEMTDEQRTKFLMFCWARSRLPGRDQMVSSFHLQLPTTEGATANPDAFLPTAQTCFFSLALPRYSSKDVLRAKLLNAVDHCTLMDADVRLRNADGWNDVTSLKESDRLKKVLRELLKEPDNRVCADCPIKSPTWASINVGVFLCMPCSGIHRSLGTHVSQVRSVDLDTWRQEWVDVMRSWGNARANAVYEAKLPPGFDGKPDETEAQNLTPKMQKFIKDKYERRKWYGTPSEAAPRRAQPGSAEEEGTTTTAGERKKRTPRSQPPGMAAPATAPAVVNLLDDDVGDDSPHPTRNNNAGNNTGGYNPFESTAGTRSASLPATGTTASASSLLTSFDPFSSASSLAAAPAAAQAQPSSVVPPPPPAAQKPDPVSNIMALFQSNNSSSSSSMAFRSPGPSPSALDSAFAGLTMGGVPPLVPPSQQLQQPAFMPPFLNGAPPPRSGAGGFAFMQPPQQQQPQQPPMPFAQFPQHVPQAVSARQMPVSMPAMMTQQQGVGPAPGMMMMPPAPFGQGPPRQQQQQQQPSMGPMMGLPPASSSATYDPFKGL